MPIVLGTPTVDGMGVVLAALSEWQHDDAPLQLHPGDLGWHWRFGADVTAAAVRTWSADGRILAVGLIDSADLLRMAVAPEAREDVDLADAVAADLAGSAADVLPQGRAFVEARSRGALERRLVGDGWVPDEPWTPLHRDLTAPVEDCGLRVEAVGPELAGVRVAVQNASFERSTFTNERWTSMAAGPAYGDARCLLAYDGGGNAVAVATVWSAGPGRPGLIEPMGVGRDHRGRGSGRAVTVAAAAALRHLGSSSATVCAETSNAAAVATYTSAGFVRRPEVRDLRRDT